MRAEPNDPRVWSDPYAIELGWLDYNGHLNMAYYHVMFDRTVDIALDAVNLGAEYRADNACGIFNVETHVLYRREVHAHDLVRVSFQLLGRDAKRLHGFQTMVREGDGEFLASSESMFVHVDLKARQVAPFPEAQSDALTAMVGAHALAGEPDQAGRRIAPLRANS
ncbi:MAG: thioesterase family protein [Pseudomonadota bacterium]